MLMASKALLLIGRLQGRLGSALQLGLLSIAFVIVAGFIWSAAFNEKRTILLDVETRAATLSFTAQANAWTLQNATICLPRETGFDPTRAAGIGGCDERRFDVSEPSDITIRWSEGTTVEVTHDVNGLAVVIMSNGPGDFPDGTRIVVEAEDWATQGALPFAAHLTVGSPMRSGLADFLLRGHWEFRQSGWAISPGRPDVSEIIKSGRAVRGSVLKVLEHCRAKIVQDGACVDGLTPATMYGHLSQIGSGDRTRLQLVALSHPGRTELSLSYFGAAADTLVRPSLIDVAISSPLLLALAVLFSILASLSQVISGMTVSFSRASKTTLDAIRPTKK